MGILSKEVEKAVKQMRVPKWKILKKCCEDDIKKMIENDVPLRKQIEIILNANVLKKLELKEYYYMLKKYFNYTGRQNEVRAFEVNRSSKKENTKTTDNVVAKNNTVTRRNVKKELSKDVDVMALAGYDVDGAFNEIKK